MVPRDAIIGIVTIDYRRHCTREKLMSAASIPVDLFNPGQVFACLGFLEAADVLLGDAEGGFNWDGEGDATFVLTTEDKQNPFDTVLEFLVKATLKQWAPIGYTDPEPKKRGEA